jgi:hypothetical protein
LPPGSGSNFFDDTFAKRLSLTVSTSAVTQQLRLNREVSGLDVVLEDAIPVNAAKVTVVIQNDLTIMYAAGHSYSPSIARTIDYTLVAADKGVKNKRFSAFVANTYTPTSIIVRAYDSSNGLIVEKTITNIQFVKNQRTNLTGSLFPTTASSTVGFTVVVNPIWETPATPVKF